MINLNSRWIREVDYMEIKYLNSSERVKLILDEIKNNKIITKQYLADKLYVSPKTIERDIKKILLRGYNIKIITGRGGGYSLKM